MEPLVDCHEIDQSLGHKSFKRGMSQTIYLPTGHDVIPTQTSLLPSWSVCTHMVSTPIIWPESCVQSHDRFIWPVCEHQNCIHWAWPVGYLTGLSWSRISWRRVWHSGSPAGVVSMVQFMVVRDLLQFDSAHFPRWLASACVGWVNVRWREEFLFIYT